MSAILDYGCLARQKLHFIKSLTLSVLILLCVQQNHPSNSIISNVIAIFVFDHISVAAILDLCQSRIFPKGPTLENGGSDM